MGVTNFETFYSGSVFHRKSDSDNDSAISMSLDNAAMEKQRTRSVIQIALADHSARKRWSWKSFTLQPAISILPSFIGRRLRGLPPVAERHDGIPALDGLRGLACLIIFNARLTANYHRSFQDGYTSEEDYNTWLNMPIVRLLWSSSVMVDILFIISGYVLAFKPMRQIHSGNIPDAHRYVTSSTIRRGMRLYLPTISAVVITAVLSWLGVFDQARSIHGHQDNVYGLAEAPPHHFVSFVEQMKDAGRDVLKLLDFYGQSAEDLRASTYDSYLWSIPAEFRYSMTLLLSLFAVSRLRTKFRLMTTVVFTAFFTCFHNRGAVLFLLGMFMADIDQLRFAASRHISFTSYYSEVKSSSSTALSKLFTLISPRSPVYVVLFFTGVMICSIPAHETKANYFSDHQYSKLVSVMVILPKDEHLAWFRIIGSAMLVWSTVNSTHLQFMFVNRFARYLGKISLAFFLVQGTILRVVLHAYIPVFYHKLGDGTKEGQSTQSIIIAWLFSTAICLPLTIWAADVFWRAIDQPCLRFAKWLEDYVSEQDEIGSTPPRRHQ